jgi:hypothetical protein
MVDIVHLYISAAPDLIQERESLSHAVAEIPVTLGWRVIQSPLHGEVINADSIEQAEVHILLLGSDIRAPIGLEWRLARHANHLPVTFLKRDVVRTMAALDFIRYIDEQTTWRKYKDLTDLRHQVLRYLAEHILAQSGYYALKSNELEKLNTWMKALDSPEKQIPTLHGGIGESSVVLSPERYIPTEGILLQAQPTGKKKKRSTWQAEPS